MLTDSVCRCGREMAVETTESGTVHAACAHCDQPCEKPAGACKRCTAIVVNKDGQL